MRNKYLNKAKCFFLLLALAVSIDASAAIPSAYSGSWFDPAFSGAGFLIEILPEDQALVYWFTYDDDGEQRWYLGVGTAFEDRIEIEEILHATGGVFGEAFDPESIELGTVGQLTILFLDCNTADVNFVINGVEASQSLTRLTTIKGLPCEAEPVSDNPSWQNSSGSWFNAARSGEGFVVELLENDRALVVWFTYDPDGDQAWLIGTGHVTGSYIHIQEMLLPKGGRFGPEHDPDAVEFINWGSVELDLACDVGVGGYDSNDLAYGSKSRPLSRLTSLAGINCEQDIFHTGLSTEFTGHWVSDGLGFAGIATDSEFSLYQVTSSSCLLVGSGSTSDLAMSVDGTLMNAELNKLILFGQGTVTPLIFRRTSAIPEHCQNGGTAFTNDPATNFGAFWDTYNDLYPVFAERNVDWLETRSEFLPQIRANMTDSELFGVFGQMLDPLNDGHVTVLSPDRFINADDRPEMIALRERANLPAVDAIINENYLRNDTGSVLRGALIYGRINSDTAYLALNRMSNYFMAAGPPDEQAALVQALDEVFNYFNDAGLTQLIIDLRRNSGGSGTIIHDLAGRLYRGRSRLVYSEQRPVPAGLSEVFAIPIDHSPNLGFSGNVALMVSPLTASSAEILTLAIRAAPHITLVGEATQGVLSRAERILPNSWIVSITTGHVESPEGSRFEVVGIPVDWAAPSFPSEDIPANRDSGIDAALQALAAQ